MTRPLQFFLSLSVCTHLVVAALWHESLLPSLSSPHTTTQISLLLQPAGQSGEVVSNSPAPPHSLPAEQKGSTETHPDANKQTAHHARTVMEQPVHERADANAVQSVRKIKPSSDEPSFQAAESLAETYQRGLPLGYHDKISTALKQLLSANFTYPRLARQRGWEGTVVISLRILPDGNLTNIQVEGSSGIMVLDRAAMYSLQKITVPQVIVAWMHDRELDMIIPIEYHLTDG